MVSFQVRDIIKATGGVLLRGEEQTEITNVVTDSREVKKGTLFVPIIGERVDAHRFIPDVIKSGAGAVFTSRRDIMKELENVTQRGACIYVEDTLAALQALAGWYRDRFDIPVIGVTGSVGKTTTKEMIGAVLSSRYRVLKTVGNLNSQIGVALMMFHLEKSTELAVFEMGISMPGEMARLVEIAKPQTAVMTNIGVSHIGNLGSREKITYEKGHIVKYVGSSHKGKLYVCGNGDLPELSRENIPYDSCISGCETIFYGTENGCRITASDIRVTESGQSFWYHGNDTCEVSLSVMGGHNVNNALIAMALGEQFGIRPEEAAEALAQYRPFSMRGERKDCHGYHIIDDTYNASPDSINSNIDALFDHGEEGEKIVVLGDVLELGEQMEKLHRDIGDFIVSEAQKGKKLSYVITVGEGAGYICRQVEENSDIRTKACEDNEEAAAFLKRIVKPGDWVLVKGSRGMHMDEVVKKVVM